MIRVTHAITGLEPGGAENYLLRLLRESGLAFASSVISLRSGGALASQFQAAGIPLEELAITPTARGILRLAAVLPRLRRGAADVMQGWMYHGNMVASAMAWGRMPVVWNIRETVYDLAQEKAATAQLIKISSRFSSRVDCIVYNSHVSRDQHRRLGFRPRREAVIPNGVSVEQFFPDVSRGSAIRRQLGIPEGTVVVGRFGRSHPMKDHASFLASIQALAHVHPKVRALIVGAGCDSPSGLVMNEIRARGLEDRCTVLGDRRDISDLYRCVDIACSTSAWGEAYPNVVAEAMASGCAVVATDVGDARTMVGDAGLVIPAQSHDLLAKAISTLVADPELRAELGRAASQRAKQHLPIQASVLRYNELYQALVPHR